MPVIRRQTVMWIRLPSVSVVPSALVQTTFGSGRPDTQQLNLAVCPTMHRFGRSRALNCGTDDMSRRRRRNDAIDVLVCTDSWSSASDARSKLELADANDSVSAPVTQRNASSGPT